MGLKRKLSSYHNTVAKNLSKHILFENQLNVKCNTKIAEPMQVIKTELISITTIKYTNLYTFY